jgi:hypothetical protein
MLPCDLTVRQQMKNILLIFLLIFLAGCSSHWNTNEEYLDYLSSLVINYQSKYGKVPEGFDLAHQESGVTLTHKSDLDGNPLIYIDFQPNAFMFRSYGQNDRDDRGSVDDFDVYYVDKKKVTREVLISLLKNKSESFYWAAYSNLFDR